MKQRPILTLALASLIFSATLLVGILSSPSIHASFWAEKSPLFGLSMNSVVRLEPGSIDLASDYQLSDNVVVGKSGEWSYCDFEWPENPEFKVNLLGVDVDPNIQPGSVFMVDMVFENTGNVRYYSLDSGCTEQAIFNVGTQMAQDRQSVFGSDSHAISGWNGGNRVKMSELYADPGEEFHVIFQSIAPGEGADIYREFFQPVLEDIAWIDEMFAYDIEIGEPTDEMRDDIQFVTDLSLPASALAGKERNLDINLSTQTMYAKFGDIAVWSMPISSGHFSTPTPPGNYEILLKQELRIGGQPPHYRMPYWQSFRWDGYGIHALPYLANDGGVFWREALNHITIPVSHGCIRTLDKDAKTAFMFTEVGTPVYVHY